MVYEQPTRVRLKCRAEADAEEVRWEREPCCLARDGICDEPTGRPPTSIFVGLVTNMLSAISRPPSFRESGMAIEKSSSVGWGGEGIFRFHFFFFCGCMPEAKMNLHEWFHGHGG